MVEEGEGCIEIPPACPGVLPGKQSPRTWGEYFAPLVSIRRRSRLLDQLRSQW